MNISSTYNNYKEGKSAQKRIKKCVSVTCSEKTLKKRVPIVQWLPTYKLAFLVQDCIAGITVALTAIPQGIAYAIVAGLPPEYGLYSSMLSGFIYCVFGSSKDVTVGPTAILSAMVSKYVSDYSYDFAVLVAFLSGVVELLMGILHLGFLVNFISLPVISGFTTAAALQIASAQLKGLFGLSGISGNYFRESIYSFVNNITTAKLWDSVLGFCTIGMLLLLKRLGAGCKRTDGAIKQLRWFISLGRNAVVVIVGMIIAYILKVTTQSEPLVLIGDIGSGFPKIRPPPFSTVVKNETYLFSDMLEVIGPKSIILPLVAVLESVAIAKAFAGGKRVDATQEMIALGFCNIIGSFGRCMPVTGSFTRTALNNASGVQTPAGGIMMSAIIILALTLITSTFYYIPKASLAGLIITAMYFMVDFEIFPRLWKNEFGIISGIVLDACTLLFVASRPNMKPTLVENEKGNMIVVPLTEKISYCAAEHVRKVVLKASNQMEHSSIIIDGTSLRSMDVTVASNLMSVMKDLDKSSRHVICLNFAPELVRLCLDIDAKFAKHFIQTQNFDNVLEFLPKS